MACRGTVLLSAAVAAAVLGAAAAHTMVTCTGAKLGTPTECYVLLMTFVLFNPRPATLYILVCVIARLF